MAKWAKTSLSGILRVIIFTCMSERLEDIIAFRKAKIDTLRSQGIEPYPSSTKRSHAIEQVLAEFDQLTDKELTIAGRIRSLRTMGKLAFAHLEDGSARMQVLLKSDVAGEEAFQRFLNTVDLGDFIEATGTLFVTKTGEKTVVANKYEMLSKSLRPLPSEHYGLEDEELRLRKRYLDILLNPEVKDIFIKKNIFWSSIRDFLSHRGFISMDMPILENIPGGAEAEPFVTHHNALDKDFYLRISLELPLKRMLVAGFEKVFEIGRIFRNEGIDREHLQDYTQIEFYWAYASFDDMMQLVKEMYQETIQKTFGTLQVQYQGQTVDWSGDWPKKNYFELFKQYTGLDLSSVTIDELKKYATENHIHFEDNNGKGRLIDLIFKKKIRILPEVSLQPCFLVNQPIEIEPLAKKDPNDPKKVQRMQILACGSELGKGFGELNDPIDQRERFEEQMNLREAGDNEAQMIDEDYLEAMEYGMPPCAGFGVSERLFSVLCDKSIRETVVFPQMKSE